MTIKTDAATLLAIARAFESAFPETFLLEDDAYRPALLIQPISQAQLHCSSESKESGNIIGLDKEKEPLIRMFIPHLTVRA